MGLFYKTLMARYGLAPLTIVFWRAAVAAGVLFAVRILTRRPHKRVESRDWLLFALFGLLGIALFYIAYVYAIALTGMGIAAVLMYSAPAWVAGLGAVLFREPLTLRKSAALGLSLIGCAMVGRAYDLEGLRLAPLGLLAGLGAGLAYSLYILFGKAATQRGYEPWSVTAYALGFGVLFLLPLQSAQQMRLVISSPETLLWLASLGIIPTLGGGVAFNAGLRTLSAGTAGIIATIEPALAALLGWLVWNEHLEPPQILGTGLIVAAVLAVQSDTAGPPTCNRT